MKQQDWTERLRERLADHGEAVPEGLWADIEQRLAPAAKPARRVVLWRWAAAAAACALVIVGLWQAMPTTTRMTLPPNDVTAKAVSAPATDGGTAQSEPAEAAAPPPAAGAQTSTAAVLPAKGERKPAMQQEPWLRETAPGDTVAAPLPSHPQGGKPGAVPAQRPNVLTARHEPDPTTPRPAKRKVALSLHATNLMASAGTSATVPMQMSPAYMGPASQALARKAPVYLSGHEEHTDHHAPLTVGLSLRLPLTDKWWVATGANYSYVSSTFTRQLGSSSQSTEQRLHYVGLPLTAGYTFWQSPRLTAYAAAGAEALLNVRAQVSQGRLERDRLQFSLLGSAGADYRLGRQLSLYVQPGLRYYPDNGSRLQNIFKERPWQFDLQLGLRYTLR